MSNYRDIIKAPIITEKSADLAQNKNTITFSVDPKANKVQIKQAVEKIFKAKGRPSDNPLMLKLKVLIQLT